MPETATFSAARAPSAQTIKVGQFRQIVLWPLQLMPLRGDVQIHRHWDFLAQPGPGNPWREVLDEFTGDPCNFQERHYAEFVNFLPYVQRVLYGEGKGAGTEGRVQACESPLRVYRRNDVKGVRITLRRGSAPLDFRIAHVDLYFFFDLDVVFPVVEIFGSELDLATSQDVLFRFGRAYPPYW